MKLTHRLAGALLKIRPAPLAVLLKAALCIRRAEVDIPEGRFWVDPASYQGQELIRHGIYEADMVATLKAHLASGSTFVDLGANEGYFSVIGARRVGPSGRVLAIEPQARLRSVLKKNFALNGCAQASLMSVAVSDRAGTADLHLTPSMNNSASGLRAPTRYPLLREPVELATLAHVLHRAGIERCDFLKIDVEGWEYEAILGSQSLFAERRICKIALELHPHLLAARGKDSSRILNFLGACGYRAVPNHPHLLLVLN